MGREVTCGGRYLFCESFRSIFSDFVEEALSLLLFLEEGDFLAFLERRTLASFGGTNEVAESSTTFVEGVLVRVCPCGNND